MKRPSIRKRLVFWSTLTITVILILGKSTLYSALEKSIYHHFDQRLDEGATVVMIEVEVNNSQVYHEWREALESNSLRRTKTLIQVWDQTTGESVRSPALSNHDLKKKYGELGERVFYNLTLPDGTPGRAVGILMHPNVEHPEGNEGFDPAEHPQVFVWAQSASDLNSILEQTKQIFLVGGAIIIVLLWIVIWILTTRLFKPVEEMAGEIISRQGDETGRAIPIPIPDRLPVEVAGMAVVFNDLLSKIDLSREKDRDFFLHLAHELRTPLAGIQFAIDQALRKPRSNEDYRRRLAAARQGTEGVTRLVNRLLKMGRVRRHGEKLFAVELDLKPLLEGIWEELAAKVTRRSLSMKWDSENGRDLVSDLDLIRMVATNLLDNAASYAREGSTVHVVTNQEPGHFFLTVENEISGDSLPPEELSRFFDPFYRRDQVRKSEDGHAGIGLGFCQEIMGVLGGTIEVTQPREGWIAFVVSLPQPPPDGPNPPAPPSRLTD